MPTLLDAVGMAGVGLVVYAYLLLQTGRISSGELKYSVFNLAGSLLIIMTLIWNFNLSSFLIESFWVAISLIGVTRYYRNRSGS